MALINLQTNKPKLNVSNINSPFGSGASIPNISAGAGSFINRPSAGIKPGKVLNIDEGQLSFNVGLADDVANLRKDIAVNRSNIGDHEKRISMLSGGVSTLNEELSEITAVIKDIGGALSLDFANRITEQKKDNKDLKDQVRANKRDLAESNLEGKKKIGKGIGSGITGLASKTGSVLGLGKILEAGKLLAAGIAINAIWPQIEKIFDWSMKNLDKILLVGGGLLALNVIGGIGTLLKFGKFFLNPKILAIMSIIGGAIAIQNFREKDFKLHPNAVNQKVKEKEKKLGRNVTEQELEDIINNKGVKTVPRDLAAGSAILPSGSAMGTTPELMFGMMLGDQMKRLFKHLFGKKNDLNSFKNRRNNNGELISSISQKPGINLIEMNLPDIRVPSNKAAKKVALPEATQVPYASSVNSANKHMTKTPEIHGIIG